MAKPVVLDADGGELDEIRRRLHDDGLDPDVDDQLKLRHVWRLYQRSEVSLKSALGDIQDLKLQQAEEMKEVENYVEHIRSLSEEREALTSEFEAENEILRTELDQRKLECDAIAEVREMLQQEGLQQVADSGLSEQVAYLLVERARLMDELETAAERTLPQVANTSADVDQLRLLLERERADHEEELKQQRENAMRVKESLAKVHDHELHELSRSRDELQEELSQARNELLKSQELNMDELQTSIDTDKAAAAELDAARRGLQQELDQLQTRFHRVEQERDTLQKEVSRLQLEQRQDKDQHDRRVSSLDTSTQNLKQQLENSKRELSDSQITCRTLEDEKRDLEVRLEFVKKDLDAVKERERQAITQKESLVSSGEGAQRRLTIQISELQSENKHLQRQLQDTRADLQRERTRSREMSTQVSETQVQLERLHSLQEEVNSLETEKTLLQEKTYEESKHRQQLQRDLDDLKSQFQQEKMELQTKLDKHRNEARDVQLALEAANREKELLQIQQRSHDQGDKVSELSARLQGMEGEREGLKRTTQLLEDTNKHLEEKLASSEQSCDDLRDTVQLQKNVNADLSTQLEEATERASNARRETANLRDQVSRLSGQLLEQRDETRDKLSRLESDKADLTSQLEREKNRSKLSVSSVQTRLEEAEVQCDSLRTQLDAKNQELHSAHVQAGKVHSDSSSLQAKLEAEKRLRQDTEDRNTMLEQEITKVWGQLKEGLERVSRAEMERDQLKQQLDMYKSRQGTRESVDAARTRAEEAERQLKEAQFKLQRVAEEARRSKDELERKNDDLAAVRRQLQEEKMDRLRYEQQVESARQELSQLRDAEARLKVTNSQLHHKVMSVDEENKSVADMHQLSELGKQSLLRQVQTLQQEVDTLQRQLIEATSKLDLQIRRYDQRKLKYKNKINRAKDIIQREKATREEAVQMTEEEVSRLKSLLQKELDWKKNLDADHKKLLQDKRDLLTRLTESDEAVRDMKRTVSSTEYRCRFLEQENAQMQDRLDALNRQKDRLDRLVRDYRIEKQREAITRSLTSIPQSLDSEFVSARPSSGLGTSLSSHILDGQHDLGTPYQHSSPILNSYLSQMNYSPGTEEDLDTY